VSARGREGKILLLARIFVTETSKHGGESKNKLPQHVKRGEPWDDVRERAPYELNREKKERGGKVTGVDADEYFL